MTDTPTNNSPVAICTVRGMGVQLTGTDTDVVDGIDLDLYPGRILGLVGESGSGKTTSGTALLGYARTGATISAGSIEVAGYDIRSMNPTEVRKIRGLKIAYVPQDPSSALNPAIRIGQQLRELLDLNNMGTPAERDDRIKEILPEVGLPNDDEFLARFPHQLSGGQVQRVALAMVFLPRPKVLVLDEPTTGLDVTTQSMVLKTLDELCERFQVAALYVTHDLAVVATIADEVAVMYAGQIAEIGPTAALFEAPKHPYTRALLNAIPHLHEAFALTGIPGRTPAPGNRPNGCRFNDRCPFVIEACRLADPPPVEASPKHVVRCIRQAELPAWDASDRVVADTDPAREREIVLAVEGLNVYYGRSHVVHDVTFDVARREVMALVGESGSGKTTISRSVGGIHTQWDGRVTLGGDELKRGARQRTISQRQRIQYIFQNPYQSLNPRRTVEQILVRPLELFGLASGRQAKEKAAELLDSVQLGEGTMSLRTNRLSGGERQRVAIARALAAQAEVLVCDEITSALDVSIQGSIVELLEKIKNKHKVAMLFVTHDLALVRSIADRILVLHHGHVVESGLTADVLDRPQQAYTQNLVAHTPTFASSQHG